MHKLMKAAALVTTAFLMNSGVYANSEHPLTPEFVDGTTRVSAEEVVALVEKTPNLVIIDSRKASDFKKGFIEGAISMPNTDTTPDSLAKVVKSKTTPVLFYCNGVRCGRSVDSSKVAMAAGYKKVYWFRGGIEEWESKGLPLVH
ncbi:MAG: rhodanese-like domain-containing protein [Gammaproteobacteria bacterium]|nr:rhodanese-like domain-containing protein [Gammaproteobacteria bacterium]